MASTATRDRVRGKTLRFAFTDGPTKGKTYEHAFHDDDTVTYRDAGAELGGPATGERVKYGTFAVADDVQLVSYRSPSGFTLTLALNFRHRRDRGLRLERSAVGPGDGSARPVRADRTGRGGARTAGDVQPAGGRPVRGIGAPPVGDASIAFAPPPAVGRRLRRARRRSRPLARGPAAAATLRPRRRAGRAPLRSRESEVEVAAPEFAIGPAGAEPRYPPIADYGLIGDGRSCALVSRAGSIDWWCLPRFDGDPVLARLLDADRGGSFSVRPRGPYRSRQAYRPGTNLLTTDFVAEAGEARLTDFMPALTEAEKRRHPVPLRSIVRRLEGRAGRLTFDLRLRVRPDFGRRAPAIRRLRADCWVVEWRNQALHLVSDAPFAVAGDALVATVDLAAGARVDLALAYSQEAPADLPILAGLDLIERLSEAFWRGWAASRATMGRTARRSSAARWRSSC